MQQSSGGGAAVAGAPAAGAAAAAVDAAERFEMVELLGRGAYGSVYKARDRATSELVAIKIISTADSDAADLERIHQEIQFLADCDHPNVVRYLGCFWRPSALWIVMEHCGGGSVGDLLAVKGSGLAEEQIAYICCEALKGLAYLHSLGKVHRDIKCGNLLLTSSGGVKLADFGVAAQLTSTMTKRNTFIGTPHWMAPEVIQESRYDGKVDVWALGISAVEMAELTPPRWRVHPLRVIFMISRDPPPGLAEPEAWSETFRDFLAQCLHKAATMRPTARYLQQHRFVVGQRPANAACLAPLIEKVQPYLSERAQPAGSAGATSAGSGSRRRLAADLGGGGATGRFSWRATQPSSSSSAQAAGDGSAAIAVQPGAAGGGPPPPPPRSRRDGQLLPPPAGSAAAAAAARAGAGAAAAASSSAWGETVLVTPGRPQQAAAGWYQQQQQQRQAQPAAAGGSSGGGGGAWDGSTVVVKTPAAAAGPSAAAAALDASTVRALGGGQPAAGAAGGRQQGAGEDGEDSHFMAALASARSAAAGGAGRQHQQQAQQQQQGAFDTFVVGSGGGAGSGTVVAGRAAGLPGFPGHAAQEDEEEDYMVALKSAVADRERQAGGARGPGAALGARATVAAAAAAAAAAAGGATMTAAAGTLAPGSGEPHSMTAAAAGGGGSAGAAAAAAAAATVPGHPVFVERLFERLAAWYESGLLVQLPFLSAASAAAPLALLGPSHAPSAAPLTGAAPGGVEGLDPEAHALLLDLAHGGLGALLMPRGGGPEQQQQQSTAAAAGGRQPARDPRSSSSTGRHQQQPQPQQRFQQHGGSSSLRWAAAGGIAASTLRQQREYGAAQGASQPPQQQWQGPGGPPSGPPSLPSLLPPHVVSKALQNPAVQNLARCVAYHRACLLEVPLEQGAACELVRLISEMGAALQTILAL